jgi:hypothetical protein
LLETQNLEALAGARTPAVLDDLGECQIGA